MRRDARRNREALLDAARELFAQRGRDVPLDDVAQAAGVSRTTLYRHFLTREELGSAVFEDSIVAIEERSQAMRGDPAGIEVLFDFVLDGQAANRGLSNALSGDELTWLTRISQRTEAAFAALVEPARTAGFLRRDVDAGDFMLAFAMAGGAFADDDVAGRVRASARVRTLLHRALFEDAGGVPSSSASAASSSQAGSMAR